MPVDRCLVGLAYDAGRTLAGKRAGGERAGSREDTTLQGCRTRAAGGGHPELVVAVRHGNHDQVHVDQRTDTLGDDLENILAGHLEHGRHHIRGRDAPDLACLRDVVEARVLDGDPGGRRERNDEFLVVGAERTTGSLRQVEVAVDAVADSDRNTEERVHRRMMVGKAGGTWVVGEVREPDGRGIRDHGAEQPLAGGKVTDVLGGDLVDADVDEALEATAARGDDAERAVAGVDQSHRRLDDATQHDFEIQALDDRGVRAEQVLEPPLRERRVVGLVAGHAFAVRHRGLPSSRVYRAVTTAALAVRDVRHHAHGDG